MLPRARALAGERMPPSVLRQRDRRTPLVVDAGERRGPARGRREYGNRRDVGALDRAGERRALNHRTGRQDRVPDVVRCDPLDAARGKQHLLIRSADYRLPARENLLAERCEFDARPVDEATAIAIRVAVAVGQGPEGRRPRHSRRIFGVDRQIGDQQGGSSDGRQNGRSSISQPNAPVRKPRASFDRRWYARLHPWRRLRAGPAAGPASTERPHHRSRRSPPPR